MEKLNYLRQDKKIPGKESFVTYVDFQVKDGTADMWLYDIFPGVQLMVVDFSSESCFRSGEKVVSRYEIIQSCLLFLGV